MADICELRYMNGNFDALGVDDMLFIFKGNVYVFNSMNTSESEFISFLKNLCTTFKGLSKYFFQSNGELAGVYKKDFDRLLNDMYEVLSDYPKLIVGSIDYEDGLILTIDNSAYDVINSPEFIQFMNSEASKVFNHIIVNNVDVKNAKLNNEPHKIQLANPLYHGTSTHFLYEILTKGLRKKQENSLFSVDNSGFVFLTSIYKTAFGYAQMYAKAYNANEAILKVNSDLIDDNKVVLDFDFVKEFTAPGKDDPYVNTKPYQNSYKGEIAQNKKRYGSKFAKIGYKGIVMPNAIEGVYIYDDSGMKYQYYDRQSAIKMLQNNNAKNESVMRINEWKPTNFTEMPQKIRLYHGTDIFALEDILLDGEINAAHGKSTGETYGVNWFFTSYKDNFARGVVFSIEVDKSEFENGEFQFMNDSEVISRNKSINIKDKDFRIEYIRPYNQETFNQILSRCNGDIYDFAQYITKHNELLDQIGEYCVDNVVTLQILRQTVGDEYLKKEGIIESIGQVNEVLASDVSLKSFEVQDELNPKIWVNDKINSRVRLRLLDIVDDFIDNLSIRWVKPEDIILTGSIANYNWSKYSDIDVHIIIDYDKVYKKKEFVQDYFDSKKELWKRDHEDLTIYNFPVEIYVQDVDSDMESNGVYSLDKNEWIKEPKNLDDAKINEVYVKEQAAKYMTLVDGYENELKKETDTHKIDKIGERVKKLLDKIKGVRKESLKRSGEMGSGNVIYKIIRRMGYLDKIWDIINNTYNKSKTIN